MAAEQLDLGAMNDRELLLLTARAVNDLSSQMELMRTRYHDVHNDVQRHELTFETQAKALSIVTETYHVCRQHQDEQMKCLTGKVDDLRFSRARYWGILIGIALGGGGIGTVGSSILLKAFSG